MSAFWIGLICGGVGFIFGVIIICCLKLGKIRDNCMPGRLDEPRPTKTGEELITDGYAFWSKRCHECGRDSMEVVRPGKVQCAYCD